jgi:isopentenyl diphosphate isomerase/L-lactate dehydrogenase-like FMN-dependent dehydrogenase
MINICTLITAWNQTKRENAENRKKSIHNYYCKTSELQSYSNTAFLKMVNEMHAILREIDEWNLQA